VEILSIITARGGSKRLPKKNILSLGGRPLIAYTIEASLSSKLINRTIVSSDDPEILDVSRRCGAEVMARPHELSTDTSRSSDVIRHMVRQLESEGYFPDIIVLLQPTSPLRRSIHIDEALKVFLDKGADTVFSVTERHRSIDWVMRIQEGQLRFILPNDLSVIRTQDHEKQYEFNGAIFIYSRDVAMSEKAFTIGDKVYPYIMKDSESVDIDSLEDLKVAEKLIA